jgi:hypothetical protein
MRFTLTNKHARLSQTMNSILHIQIDVPEQVHEEIETAQGEIEKATGFSPSLGELYVFAMTTGVETVAQDYIDAVIVAIERRNQKELPLPELASLSR